MTVQRGELWWADLAEPRGSEPALRRPVLVLQAGSFNRSRLQGTGLRERSVVNATPDVSLRVVPTTRARVAAWPASSTGSNGALWSSHRSQAATGRR